MNKRILKLFNEAGFHQPEMERLGIEEKFEKFAELIVRECMKVAVNKDSGYIHPANIAGYMAAGRSTAAQMIKEHFGVEE